MNDSIDFDINGDKFTVDLKNCPTLREMLSDEEVPPAEPWTMQDESNYRRLHPENDAIDWGDER